jgi:enamine deaminase RidA (YjgF/YER057c/UK114 family)
MTSTDRSHNRHVESFGAPWEALFGYEQAVEQDGIIYISGQLSHEADGTLVAPAALDASGRPRDFSNTEAQIRRTYQNAVELLARFGATLDDVVEETVYVIDMPSAFPVAAKVRKEMYGVDRPAVANSLVGVAQLAQPTQLVEISFRAVLGRRRSD